MNAHAHTQGIGHFLARERRRQVAERCRAGRGADAGIERHQEDAAAHTLHEAFGSDGVERAILLLQAEKRAYVIILPAVTHEMHDAVALVRYLAAYLLDGWRVGAFQCHGPGDFANDLLQARPLAIDVEWVQPFVERIGWYGYDVQAAIQRRRSDALVGRQSARERVFRDEKAVGAISIFPGDSIDGIVGGDEQDTLGHRF